jgi:hypothetical protein
MAMCGWRGGVVVTFIKVATTNRKVYKGVVT